MAQYRSYLLRWWDLQSGEWRIEVEHLQSGERTVVATVEEAVAWLAARSDPAGRRAPQAGRAGDPAAEEGVVPPRRAGTEGG